MTIRIEALDKKTLVPGGVARWRHVASVRNEVTAACLASTLRARGFLVIAIGLGTDLGDLAHRVLNLEAA